MEDLGLIEVILILAIILLLVVGILISTGIVAPNRAEAKAVTNINIPIWRALMAEAVSEGYDGMYAVACVIRNRGGDLHGLCGAKRKDLVDFCNRQGRRLISQAREIERIVFELGGHDTTGGATLFENIEKFGWPKDWDKSKVIQTVKIKNHTFFKEIRICKKK